MKLICRQMLLGRRIVSVAIAMALCGLSRFVAADDVPYTDKLGRKVVVHAPVHRAVVFQFYEFIPALNCWSDVAGVSRYAFENDLMLAAKPDIRSQIPSVGSGADVNIEALLKLRPDLVFTWTFKPENVQFMEQKGLSAIALYPDSVAELYNILELHGRLFQCAQRADAVRQEMDRVFDLVKTRSGQLAAGKRKKLLWIGGRQTSVAGAGGLTDVVINLLGGCNAAAGINERNADVSIETIIGWNPDVIFIWGNAKYDAKEILDSPQWRSIQAVRSGQVYKAPDWNTWSPRLALVTLWMAMKTYPELYKEVEFCNLADQFYRNVFGLPYTRKGTNAF